TAVDPERIPQRVVLVRVAVRPAVHRDGHDVACRVEAPGAQHARELIAHVALERVEGGCEELALARPVLLAPRQTGPARRAHHVNDDRLLGPARWTVASHADRQVQVDRREEAARAVSAADAQRAEAGPAP